MERVTLREGLSLSIPGKRQLMEAAISVINGREACGTYQVGRHVCACVIPRWDPLASLVYPAVTVNQYQLFSSSRPVRPQNLDPALIPNEHHALRALWIPERLVRSVASLDIWTDWPSRFLPTTSLLLFM